MKAAVAGLLADGLDVNEDDENGLRPLYHATSRGDLSVVKLLLKEDADINAQGGFYGNALQAASVGGHEKIVKQLSKGVTSMPKVESTATHYRQLHMEATRRLLSCCSARVPVERLNELFIDRLL